MTMREPRNTRLWTSCPLTMTTALAFFIAAGPAQAQEGAKADPLAPLRECQAIAAAAERLACFDRASAALTGAADAGDLSVVNRDAVRKTRRTLFGFALPDLGIFGDGDKARGKDAVDEVEVLDTTIAAARTTSAGIEITTAEGAVWLIDKPPRRLMTPRAGQAVQFRKGTLGSYFIGINGQGGVKGRRIG